MHNFFRKIISWGLGVVMVLFLCLPFTFAQDNGGLQYEMVSYSTNNKDASTPFFDLAFFNKRYFTINYQSFTNAFQFLFDMIIGVSIAIAVILFMVGAFEGILTDTGSVSTKLNAKKRMQDAIVGLMIILSTWLIINTINPDLLRLPIFTDLDKLKAATGGGSGGTGQSNVFGRSAGS